MAAPKRSKDQILADRARIAELKFQHYTDREIRDILAQETGIQLSERQINYDMNRIRDSWLEKRLESYGALVARELDRLDATEAVIWRAMKENAETGKQRHVIEEAERGTRTVETIEKAGVDPRFISQILDCQKERRKLLGLYAPQLIGIRKEVVKKAYVTVSPDDWPDADVIDGEFTEQKRISG